MMFGPKRAHVMFIFENFIKDFGLFLVAVIIFLFVRDIQVLMENVFLVVIALFGPISRLIAYFFTRYTIDGERLLVESGWLKKEKLEIPLATISSVDMTQNLLFQLTHVYALQIENAGSIGNAGEGSVKLILSKDDAAAAKKLLLSKKEAAIRDGETEQPVIEEQHNGQTMRASAGEVLTMCIFQIKWVVVAVQMVAYISILGTYLDQYIFNGEQSSTELLVDFAMGFAPVMIIGAVLGIYIVSVIISTVFGFIKYYNFRITNKEDSLRIEYGLFTRKSHTLMKEKISGITYQQSLIMRLMKKGTLQIFVTGYGGVDENNQQETVLLYPVVEERKLYRFINWIMPENVENPVYEKAPARSVPYFFVCTRFIISLILLAGAVLVQVDGVIHMWIIGIAAAITLIVAGSVLMEYRTSAVAFNGSVIAMNYGSYRKITVLLHREKMEYVEDFASEVKRSRHHLSTINAGVLAPAGMSSHRVRNMDTSVFDNIKEKLIY